MSQTAYIPISCFKRVPFDGTIVLMGQNLTGATALMEIRQNPGDQGAPLVSLGAFSSGQGISISWDATYPDPDGTLPNGASLVRIRIAEATLKGLLYNTPASADLVLHYDIHITPSGGTKYVYSRGEFTIMPGVTL